MCFVVTLQLITELLKVHYEQSQLTLSSRARSDFFAAQQSTAYKERLGNPRSLFHYPITIPFISLLEATVN